MLFCLFFLSALGWCFQHDWSIPRKWTEHFRPQHRAPWDTPGSHSLQYILCLEQEVTNNPLHDVERSISLVTNWLLYAYDRWLFYFGDWLVASMLVLALRFFLNCQCSSLANPITEGYVLLLFIFWPNLSFHRMPSNFFFQSFSLCTTLTFFFFVCCTKLEKIKCNNHQ